MPHIPDSTRIAVSNSVNRRTALSTIAAAGFVAAFGGEAEAAPTAKKYRLTDGTHLNYLEQGSGKVLLLFPGWSQSANEWVDAGQFATLADKYRVIALDPRGYGDSDKSASGYHCFKQAQDLHEFLVGLNLKDVAVLAHSLGNTMFWAYWQLYRNDRVSHYVFVDQAPMVTQWPSMSGNEIEHAGSIFTPETLYATAEALVKDAAATRDGFISAWFNPTFLKAKESVTKDGRPWRKWLLDENLKFPAIPAAHLLIDGCVLDGRTVIPTIRMPTLVIGGEKSFFRTSWANWVGSQIPNSRVVIFKESEGGSHFMHAENPTKFAAEVKAFAS